MATRSPKPKTAAKAAKKPKAAKSARAAKPAGPKGKGRGKPRADSAMAEADAAAAEPLTPIVAFEQTPKLGFFARRRQRRAAKAAEKAEERRRKVQEAAEAEERAMKVAEEQRALQAEHERAEAERQAAEAQSREAEEELRRKEEAAAERKAKSASRREQARHDKDADEARKAEEAIAQAAEEARLAEEKERKAEEARQKRAAEREAKRREMEDEERRKAEAQAAKDAEEEAERQRKAELERIRKEEAKAAEIARKLAAKELEPEMEFEEASEPVASGSELVPAAEAKKGGQSAVDVQADLMVAELARRRSKPIVLDEELPEPPKFPKAPLREGEEERELPARAPKPQEDLTQFVEAAANVPTEAFGFTVPEAFLLLANGGHWDERSEKLKPGSLGGALAASLLLELLMARAIQVQRDRIVPTGVVPDDPSLRAVLDRLRIIRDKKGDIASLRQMTLLAKRNRELLEPTKQSLQERALADHGSRRHLGLFHRSWLDASDPDIQERLQNRLRRAIAGGGTPEPHSVLLLGLLDAVGQFAVVVPDEAADYNRKRLNGLLGGRDIMGYKVHPDLKALQEIATRTILNNVRLMTTRG